ncbi:MAG TPA: succinate dehydrogenase, hydrophobic membrane anchor protein [Micavibrio sp.]|nr:succinate dehydrogenase, hydrophobic membrane anchor protein [Micavibrio sp.]
MNDHTDSDHSCCGCGSHGFKKGEALSHWLRLRVLALILVPLTIWLVVSVAGLAGADHAAFTEWLSAHFNAALLGAFILIGSYHAALGVQEIIEDYVSCEKTAKCTIAAEKIAFALVAVVCILSIVKIVVL